MKGKPLTTLFIALNVIGFGIEIIFGVSAMSPTADALIAIGGNYPPYTLGGQPWRVLTAMFLHAGLIHIALNMFGLYQARGIEDIFKGPGYIAIYLVSGLIGNVAGLIRGGPVGVGASGAVFGLFGAYGAYLLMMRGRLGKDAVSSQLSSLGMFLVLNIVIGVTNPVIDLLAHLVGFVVGGGVAYFIAKGGEGNERKRAFLALGLGVAVTVVLLFILPVPRHA